MPNDKWIHFPKNPYEGQINTGMMMRTLRSKVNRQNISFFSNVTLNSQL